MEHLISTKTGRTWGVAAAPLAAAMLTDGESLRYLLPFLRQVCTASQAARGAGARIDTMLYRIERMQDAGLLQRVEGTGRKRYRATTDRYVIPFEATRFESLVELMLQNNAVDAQRFARALVASMAGDGGGWMVRVHCDDDEGTGRYTIDAAPQGQLDWDMTEMLAPAAPATWYTNQSLRLEPTQAKALQHDLYALWQRYEALTLLAKSERPHTRLLLQLHLAPTPLDTP